MTNLDQARWNWKRRLVALLTLTTITGWLTVGGLYAATPVIIEQSGIAFLPKTVSVKAGSTVTFLNSDVFGHNVYSDSDGGEFDIGLQPGGAKTSVVFENSGRFGLRCRIHPRMRAEIIVTP
ncbi:plastocyanin/azurin family copper-binding protein [Nisaea sp.]|uniref:cupredoxin domain-containing protein n=1 Tax=Nisaea sp. TaxID=2024842 RepID=UPI00326560E9